MVLEDATLSDMVSVFRGVRLDIQTQLPLMMKATGSVREAYQKVLLDKLWKLDRMVGTFYYETLAATGELQRQLDALASEAPASPMFEDDYQRWKAKMKELEAHLPALKEPSDTPSAAPPSEPSQ